MKWMLISMMLANPMVYANEKTCNVAADALKNVDIEAVCIPAGEQAKNNMPTVEFRNNYGVKIFQCWPQIVGSIDLGHGNSNSIAEFMGVPYQGEGKSFFSDL